MRTLRSLEQRYIQAQTQLSRQQGQKALLDQQAQQARADKLIAQERLALLDKVQALLLRASVEAREGVTKRIEHWVTTALTVVKDEAYAFRMRLVQQGGQWVVDFKVVTPYGIEVDVLNQCGGGVADVVSMALRVAVLEMYQPRVDGPILLDENFKFLSREHTRTAIEFIRKIAEKTGRQILLVTHVPELAAGADQVLEVRPEGETSSIVDVTREQTGLGAA